MGDGIDTSGETTDNGDTIANEAGYKLLGNLTAVRCHAPCTHNCYSPTIDIFQAANYVE